MGVKLTRSFKIKNTQRAVARKRLMEAKASDQNSQTPGFGPGRIFAKIPAKGRRAKGVFGVSQTAGGLMVDPRYELAKMIGDGLRKPPRFGICTVYDAKGKPIATIDPFTRERKPIV